MAASTKIEVRYHGIGGRPEYKICTQGDWRYDLHLLWVSSDQCLTTEHKSPKDWLTPVLAIYGLIVFIWYLLCGFCGLTWAKISSWALPLRELLTLREK